MAFQTSSSDLALGISRVHAGAAVSRRCLYPCRRALRPGMGDTGDSAVLASCLGKMASAAGQGLQISVMQCM